MKPLRDILIIAGLSIWILVGIVLLYRYGVLERYEVGSSGSRGVLVRNSITGTEMICSGFGCQYKKAAKTEQPTSSSRKSVYLPDKNLTVTFPEDATKEEMEKALNEDLYSNTPPK